MLQDSRYKIQVTGYKVQDRGFTPHRAERCFAQPFSLKQDKEFAKAELADKPRSREAKDRKTEALDLVTGFTLVEILVAISVMALILGILSPIGLNFYLDYQFESEVKLLSALLQQTRNLAMVNRNESNHGLYFDAANFIIFQGASFASRVANQDKTFPRSQSISISGPSEIIFTALSGQTVSVIYTISNGQKSREVYVNAEGLVY